MHGLSEFFAIRTALKKVSILVIDDSPLTMLNIYFLSPDIKVFAEDFYKEYGLSLIHI